ncbi:MAG: hypothetical protein OXE77_02510 [Flavobacteriaceae bacterium]|nr:hypothetical protein [Flavobacteriaceae bacterium]MCY4268039.1 hypothetical protein [Flavobacteriaceae bacterium]MCY4298727.1 hypothetical protein [Flavobacteriaceae bacterium]
MEKYLKNVYNIYKNFSGKEDFYPGPRLTRIDNENPKYLILGINPSNSIDKVKQVLSKASFSTQNSEEMERLRKLKQKLNSQSKYDEFLCFENYDDNRTQIAYLQNLAHKFHSHFIKHNYFLEKLGLCREDYAFFDLFPLWQIKQCDLIKKLKLYSKLKKDLLDELYEFLIRKKSIEYVLFLNVKAYNVFSAFQRLVIRYKNEIPIKMELQKRNCKVRESSISLNGRNIKAWGFGIGGRFGYNQMDELASHFKHRFN